jgi:hypothetical protein
MTKKIKNKKFFYTIHCINERDNSVLLIADSPNTLSSTRDLRVS